MDYQQPRTDTTVLEESRLHKRTQDGYAEGILFTRTNGEHRHLHHRFVYHIIIYVLHINGL